MVHDLLDRLIKHALQIPLRQGRALEVLDRLDLLGHLHGLLVLYRLHLTLSQLLLHLRVVAQVELGADEDDGHAGRMMFYFGVPLWKQSVTSSHVILECQCHSVRKAVPYLRLNIVKTRRADNAEADQEDVRLRVAQRPKPIIVFLSRRVPQAQADGLVVHHHARAVVVEDGRDVLAGEGVGGVGDEQTGFADGSVACDDAFERLRCGCGHRGRCEEGRGWVWPR